MSEHTRGGRTVRSAIARSDATSVHVHGLDLIEMLGTVNLGDFAYLELFGRLPDQAESTVFNAMVVSLVEHGLTPSALVTRTTYLGAPESIQGAVAAGLLGLGDTYVGTIEGAARVCANALEPGRVYTDSEIDEIAAKVFDEHRAVGKHVAGLGHPVHKPVDPRAEKLFAVAEQNGLSTSAPRLMRALSARVAAARGSAIPVNVTGAIGSLAATLGISADIARGLGVMARAIGLVGHLLEERSDPIAATVWTRAERESMELD